MQIKVKNDAGEWEDGIPDHGEPVKYIYSNGASVETYYSDPNYVEPEE